MKKLLGIVVLGLFLITPSQADDIRDFQIEGMSLGDSALNYFSIEEIKKYEKDFYRNKKYTTSNMLSSKFEVYDDVQISYKTKDNKYILVDISGIVNRDYKECLKEIKSLSLEFEEMFPNTSKRNLKTYPHRVDKTGETKISDIFWRFNNGDLILLACYNWNSDYGKKKVMWTN